MKEIEIPEGYEARIDGNKVIMVPKESENEKIRKALIHLISEQNGILTAINGISVQDILAWLERQKDETQRQFNLGIQAGREEVMYELEKEQKPIRSVAQLPGNNDVFDANLNEIKNIDEAAGYYMQGEIDTDSDCLDEDGQPLYYADALRKAFLFGAKWQKEQNVPGYKTDDYFCEKCQENAFNAGKEAGLKEQKPAEWSEEDEKMLNAIIEDIHCGTDFNAEVMREANIREKWLRERLKSLRPYPHWKPSKKQMWALEWKINNTPVHAWQRKELESIYKELLKSCSP